MSARNFILCLTFFLVTANVYSHEPDYTCVQMDVTLKELDSKTQSVTSSQFFSFYYNKITSQITADIPPEIINWFDSDLGLLKNGYTIKSCRIDGKKVITEYITTTPQPIFKVEKSTDELNKVTEVSMYANENDLFSKARINKYESIKGFSIPSVIKTDYYEGGKIKYVFQLEFNNIKNDMDRISIQQSNLVQLQKPLKLTSTDIKKEEYSFHKETREFNTTSSKILVNAAYSFYKKYITEQDLSGCSYWPSCSSYMRTAVAKYGLPGIIMGLERVKRCSHIEKSRNLYPLSPRGFQLDYVK